MTIRWLAIFLTLFALSNASADTLRCKIGGGIWNYFDSTDKKQRKRCKGPSELVAKSLPKVKPVAKPVTPEPKAEPIKSLPKLQQASKVKPSCGGSGGVVKVNGKVFHLLPSAICGKYQSSKNDSHSLAYKPRLFKVNAGFRRSISAYVKKIARKYRLEPEFIHAVISAESAYNPNAKSHAGAQGLMQLMPTTGRRFGVTNPYNPYQNIDAGARYLRILLDEFGSMDLAAAGYNAGEGAVRKYNNSIPPYRETRKYVPKVRAFYQKYKANPSLISGG